MLIDAQSARRTTGARPALLRGRLAGLAACKQIGIEPTNLAGRRRKLVRNLARAQAFADGLNSLFAPQPDLASQVRADTTVCRCEEVTRREILAALDDGADSVYGAKLWTRAGMGRCQGRMCADVIARLAGQVLGSDMSELRFNHPRLPLRPVPLNLVADTFSDAM